MGKERDKMPFGHRVMDSDELLIFHILDGHHVVAVSIFRFQSGQRNTAAGSYNLAEGMDHIAADGTDIEFTAEHIGGDVFVGDMLSVHQFDDGNAQYLGQQLQGLGVWCGFSILPAGYCLPGYEYLFRQLFLG